MWVIRSDLIVLRIVPAFNKVILPQGLQPSHVGDQPAGERKTRSETDTGSIECTVCHWFLCDYLKLFDKKFVNIVIFAMLTIFVKEVGHLIEGLEEFDPLKDLFLSAWTALLSSCVASPLAFDTSTRHVV